MKLSFLVKKKPQSYNSWKKTKTKGQNYIAEIRKSLSHYNAAFTMLTGDLYGISYYFHSSTNQTDADNISKPIWDSLTGFLFDDDKQVKLRMAGKYDLSTNGFDLLDVTGVPGLVVADLVDAVSNDDHFLFIECGKLKPEMFKFNLQ